MTPFWTQVIRTPFEDVCSSVCIIFTAYPDGFQGECGQCEQQCSDVPALVESVLDIRRSGKVLPAVVWTPNHCHDGGDAGRHCDIDVDDQYDHSVDPTEA